jgi:DNA-binding response OmpR family regulator
MASRNPRIIVVDNKQELYNIVRSALDLLDRRPRYIHVHSAEDALVELKSSGADLMVTTQTLDEIADGTELALQAKRELAAVPVIVLGEATDPVLEGHTDDSLFVYLRRPFVPEAFIRAMRVALDGPEAAPKDVAQAEDLMPVPEIDYSGLSRPLFQLMRDVGAMAAVLSSRTGKVLSHEGAAGYIDRDLIASVLGSSMHGLPKMLSIIGDQPRVMQHYDGDRSDIFALALGLHYIVILIYDGNAPNTALGNVRRFGFAAINDMLALIGTDIAFSTHPIAAPPPKRETGTHRRRKTEELRRPPPQPELKPQAVVPEVIAPAEAIPNFDPSIFDSLGSVDLSQADDLFSGPNAGSGANANNGSKISFEDAMMQGILGDLGDS